MNTQRSSSISCVAASVCLIAIATASYWHVLELPFLGIDTIPTIAAARVGTLGEVPSVLSRELRGGITPFPPYYRPLTLLTYTVDYALWKWNPFGYHLTDLILHSLAVVSVLWMALVVFKRSLTESVFVALLFLMHPAANEVVPAISRRQEPLLMLGGAVALLGATMLPRMVGWSLATLGVLIAITSVERGLILPAVLWAFLYLIRLAERPWRQRLRLSLLWSSPFIALAVGFYGIRWLIFGDSGIGFSAAKAIQYPIGHFVSIVYPQQIVALQWPSDTMSTVLTSLLGLFLILPVGWTLLRSPQRNLYIFCCAAITMNGVMLGVAGQLLPWYPYTGAAFFAVLIVALVAESIDRVRTSSLRKTGAVVVLVATVVFLAPTLSASPLLGAYRGWVVAGEQLNNVMAGILNAIDGRHKDVGVVLINVPSHFRENGSEYRVTRSAAILWPYSLQPWLDSHGIDNPVVLLGTSSHVGEIRVPRAEITNAGTLRVYFDSPDSVYSAEEFTWPPERLREKRFLTFIYDGAKFQRFESANAATSHY